jgi:uncharacterized membrane protein YecN with MAPEG domain
MLLPITLIVAAACAVLNLWLAIRCSRARGPARALHGDGGDPRLAKRMRAHANFNEYTPIVLILFALIELAIGAAPWLWMTGLIYVLARLAHAIGMEADRLTVWRAGGIIVTWLILLGLAVTAVYVAYSATREVPAPPALAALT